MRANPAKLFDKSVAYCYKIRYGAVAQLGECLTGSQEVEGSIPFSSTNSFKHLGHLLDGLFF